MIYHRIAVNVPLSDGLLTYSHSEPLPQGARVLVPFRNKTVVGIVWGNGYCARYGRGADFGCSDGLFGRAAAA